MKKNHTGAGEDEEKYYFTLYISGTSPNSLRAINNITGICENHLKGNYTLDIIDVYQEKVKAQEEQLIALPLLVKRKPGQIVKLIGDLSETKKVTNALGIKVKYD